MMSQDGNKVNVISRIYCKMHPSEELACYCVECDKLICFRCNMIDHKHHISKEIHEVAEDRREQLQCIIDNGIEGKVTEIQAAKNDITHERAQLESDVEEMCNHINNQASEIQQRVEKRRKEMIDDLHMKVRSRFEEYDRKLELLNQQMKSTIHDRGTTKNVMKSSRDDQLIVQFSLFKTRLDETSYAATVQSTEQMTIEYDTDILSQEKKVDDLMAGVAVELKLKKPVEFKHLVRTEPPRTRLALAAVCWFGEEAALVGGGTLLKLIHTDGRVEEEIYVGETIYDIVRDHSGQVFIACTKSIKTLDVDLQPRTCFSLDNTTSTLACTPQGDILIGHTGEMIQYTREGKQVKTWNTVRDDGYKIEPYKATFNVNGDLVVTDMSSNDVTVFDVNGKIRTVIQTDGMELRGVTCSRQGHILVADFYNDCVNIYSMEGIMLQTVIPEKDNGLYGPYGISLHPDGHLWIGQYDGCVSVYKLSF